MKNRAKFRKYFAALCEIHERIPTESLSDIYWEILALYSDTECERAFEHLIRTSHWFPKPVDFLEILEKIAQQQEENS